MTSSLHRLLAPRSVALFGSTWADAVAAACRKLGFQGELWRVHPKRPSTAQQPYYRSVDELPTVPDAAFVAAPNIEVPAIAAALQRRGAGGFVCFASGFDETATPQGLALGQQLRTAAGELPYFGPNCYGFINFFDRVALWPDQVVGSVPERGVAILCQSGTIALNLLFNQRSLPLGYVISVGNQARIAIEDLIESMSQDPRITAFGIYIEGIQDASRFAAAVECARRAGKPIALVKAGRTEAAARTARSHTGSLAGADAAFDAFCRQAGIARCETLGTLCETLKIFHTGGALAGRRVLVMGASGGDMAMTADVSRSLALDFAPLPAAIVPELKQLLTDKVTLSNPFDFHTHIWFDLPAMKSLFARLMQADYHALCLTLDSPPEPEADASAYTAAIDQFLDAATETGVAAAAAGKIPTRAMLISSLPESTAAAVRVRSLQAGVAPLQGQREALEALDLAAAVGEAWAGGSGVQLLRVDCTGSRPHTLTEHQAKQALAQFGVKVPRSHTVNCRDGDPAARTAEAATTLGYPVVIKALDASLEHKSELGAVVLNVRSPEAAAAAANRLRTLGSAILVEEMVGDGVAEVLVGMTVDPQFGQMLLLGAGGVMTELLRDKVILLPPFTREGIDAALRSLRLWPLLAGFRGRPAGDVSALVDAVLAVTRYAHSKAGTLIEMDLNPIIVRPAGSGVVAVDALVRLSGD